MTVERIGQNLTSLRRVVYGLAFALAIVGVGVVALSLHVLGRQTLANHRAEAQRRAICAILANIPGRVPPEIAAARGVFARPGHPSDCQPLPRVTPPTSHRQATAKPGSSPGPGRAQSTVIVVRPTTQPAPSPVPTHAATPRPHPTRTPTPPPPHPTPSPTCDLLHPLRCLPGEIR